MKITQTRTFEADPYFLYTTPDKQEYAVVECEDKHFVCQQTSEGWVPLGSGMDGLVYSLAIYNGKLIAGGDFDSAGGVKVNYIAQWDGTDWSSLGSGLGGNVEILAVYNGDLIAGGCFWTAGGVSAEYIAKWNGTNWAPLGEGLDGLVLALTVYNGELIAGGDFTTDGEVSAKCVIAKWNGSEWSPLGSGWDPLGDDDASGYVCALEVYNGELVAEGQFTTAGGVGVYCKAKWDGKEWTPVETPKE